MYGLGWIDDVSIQKDAWIHFVSEFTAKLLCFGKMPYEYPVEAIPRPIMEARDRPELVLPRPRPCGKLQLQFFGDSSTVTNGLNGIYCDV
jgi:hypothetical protein